MATLNTSQSNRSKKSLRAVNLIKLKRSSNMKIRMCKNGAPHHKFLPWEEFKSPTMTLGLILATMVVDTY